MFYRLHHFPVALHFITGLGTPDPDFTGSITDLCSEDILGLRMQFSGRALI